MPSQQARDRAWAVFAIWGLMTLLAGAMLYLSAYLADSPNYPDQRGLLLFYRASLALPAMSLLAMTIGIWAALRDRPVWILAPAPFPVATLLIAIHGYVTYVTQPGSP